MKWENIPNYFKGKLKRVTNLMTNNSWYLITSIASPSSSFIKLHFINTIQSRISRCNSNCLVQFIYLPIRKPFSSNVIEICYLSEILRAIETFMPSTLLLSNYCSHCSNHYRQWWHNNHREHIPVHLLMTLTIYDRIY